MNRRWGVLLVVAAVAAVAIFFATRHDEAPAKATTQRAGSAQVAPVAKAAVEEAARAQVTVTSDAGPIANAAVRLSHEGDVTLVQTGSDGVARVEGLEPGEWSISASADGHEPAAATARELRGGETAKIDIKLTAGGRVLSGLVTDASGGPIAGARIDAGKVGALARPTDAIASTTTGADGRYKMAVAEGPLLVAASEPSYAPQSKFVDGATADFQLVPGGVIEGIVRDDRTREPVAGAQVTAQRERPAMLFGERSRHRAVSGSDGRFRITGLRPGAWELDARAPHRTSQSPTVVGIGVAEQVTDVEILIGTSPVIRGVVVDDQGQPVPEIEVTAFGAGRSGERGTTDGKGAFAIEGLVPGSYMLMARSEAYLPAGTTKVTLAAKDLDDVKVSVTKGLRVKGHVEPRQVCDVELEMGEAMMGGPLQMFTPVATGADGEFDLGPAKPGAYDVRARCASGEQGHAAVKAPTTDVVVAVKPGASIAGKVVDGKGQPVVAVAVSATSLGGTERTTIVNGMMVSGVQTRTNGKGEFELRGLGAGPYRLRVLDRGRPLPMKTEAKVTLGATEKKTGVTLAVERPDGVIRGIVTGPDGKPLADAWVSLHQSIEDLLGDIEAGRGESRMVSIEASDDGSGGESSDYAPVLTDASGKFEITNLPRVPWTVIAEAQAGKLRGRATKVVPDASITIQAAGLSELKGTVRVPGGGAPPAFAVELDGPTREQRAFATPDGTFSFGRVDPGDYTVTVTSTAGNGKAAVKVQPGQPATVTIDLSANATVIGKLVDGAGKPLGGLPVAVVPDANDGSLRIELSGPPPTSNPDGTFRLEAKAGLSAVLVLVPPRPVSKRGLTLEPGKTLDVGTITVETGAPPQP